MDLQTRKIVFVQEFLKLQSERAISHLESLLKKETQESQENPLSIEEYQTRIKQSIEDSKNDRVTEADDLLSEIEKWS
ncbi:hypothetical protein G6047_00350 [Flavobacterium sp. SE-s28]|uniref:Uncharacterized protein n=2 Tax=Flavobacterium silvaticum TaxID=1852020 RepID=A0A972JER9_9FLAO|nr:hypothetical protein [Flavobacterium silvaticum]